MNGRDAELLRVEDLTVTFDGPRGPVDVVRELSLSVEPGGSLGIVGESGSGKSMTSLAVMGLLPPGARRAGRVWLSGRELTALGERQLRRMRGDRVAMVFQDPLSSLNPYYTVGTQIAEAYRAHRQRATRREARRVAIEAMERVHIDEAARRVDHYPHQFSGGMRQRVMIAMALCTEPDLLIADEPTTALDVTVQAQILRLLAEVRRDTGAGLVLITHDLAVVSEVADEVLVMRAGACVERADAERLFSDPQHPYTRALLDAVPRLDDELGELRAVGEPADGSGGHEAGHATDRGDEG
ncbi:ATP-binding cassette domain-containing protein [Streptomyces sp. 3MP-14]|uniref:ATP-binding cassette domain-containing protein n=1 Tax=Streptomyces mimosae TaxID=2586635 RepID=A0A5N6AP23_9ACTN|nr:MULTISPECIES: ABC transporter ATP-binding protein [Streptomyces]KAB8169872.1 ATP-binding cassette domain-containing protein [Streptomyces mimosae]KAB8178620.1 ATP-binding cassette domain-containing protein [Streptomyces sp. 3MP-14]